MSSQPLELSSTQTMKGKYDGRKGNGNANLGRFIRARMRRELIDKAIVALGISLDSPDKQLEAAKFVIEQVIGRAPNSSVETKRAIQDNRLQFAIQNLIVPNKIDKPTLELQSGESADADPSSRETP